MFVPVTLTPGVEEAIAETDFDEYAVVDVVEFLPGTTTKFEDDHLRTEVYRYRTPPPTSVYENAERRYRIRRVTRPLAERLD
jgi:hypothetical protein